MRQVTSREQGFSKQGCILHQGSSVSVDEQFVLSEGGGGDFQETVSFISGTWCGFLFM